MEVDYMRAKLYCIKFLKIWSINAREPKHDPMQVLLVVHKTDIM
jgi:hypothetical protein